MHLELVIPKELHGRAALQELVPIASLQLTTIRMSSSVSSSSLANHTLRNNPMCTCGKPASLRTSNTPPNSWRSLFGCPKGYHTSAISNESITVRKEKKEFVKIEIELLRKDEELRKREEEIAKRELGVHNDQVDIQRQQADIRRERTLLRIYWVISI
ncbi:hypothetical protein F2P56_003937 [Juglans regia]|uniref:Uncharacterized protein n=2 Tax=Juglans regia TaxID=51240 RepID=A0A833Y4I8_JUGRE|nr:uncharacterized protein LOC109014680 [Juglans regia]KAF5477286.1 hypothetical protein F2P56_003937 [Juglans regia]